MGRLGRAHSCFPGWKGAQNFPAAEAGNRGCPPRVTVKAQVLLLGQV